MVENQLCAKRPPHLNKCINQAYIGNGTYEQIVKHLERELEQNGLEAEPLVKTQIAVTKKAEKTNNNNKKTKLKIQNTNARNSTEHDTQKRSKLLLQRGRPHDYRLSQIS